MLFHETLSSVILARNLSYEAFITALPDSACSRVSQRVIGQALTREELETEETVCFLVQGYYVSS